MTWHTKTSSQERRRRGGTYVLVMGSSMIIAVIGIAAVMALRVERRYTQGTSDFASARAYALSAVEMGFDTVANDPNWRVNQPNGYWFKDKPMGAGTYTLQGVDPADADLADNDTGSLVLTGIGMRGQARFQLEVTLVAETRALTCLEIALHSGGNLAFKNATVNCNQTIGSNASVSTTGASTINSDVEAVGGISGAGYNGTTTTPITPRTMPDPSTVFDFYTDPLNGTSINISDIPLSGGYKEISNVVLSPNSNPFGSGQTNPNGIYVIDAQANWVLFKDCRIVGTIVLQNASYAKIEGAVNWEPAVPNYPALLVNGGLDFYHDGTLTLSEAVLGVNLNPPGTPYGGEEDTIEDDSYPSLLKGLLFISGQAGCTNQPVIDGVLVVGSKKQVPGSEILDLTYRQSFLDNPPPGFTAPPQMVISPGTWRRVVD